MMFNTEMVKAILEGRKTVTRRVVKPQPEGRPVPMTKDSCWPGYFAIQGTEKVVRLPYQPGDILWVRETWRIQSAHRFEADAKIEYKSGGPMGKVKFKCRSDYDRFIWNQPVGEGKWKPSIHMPKEAARIFLRVTDVRAERLQEISSKGALFEGVPNEWTMSPVYCPHCKGDGLIGTNHPVTLGHMDVDCPCCKNAVTRFSNLWNSTIKPADIPTYGWGANPYVWVIEFECCEKPEGWPC
jgi:hypothetical protein